MWGGRRVGDSSMQYAGVTELVVAGAVAVVVADGGGWVDTGHVRLINPSPESD